MLLALFQIADFLLNVLVWIIIIQVILSWLFAFNVLNAGSAGLRSFVDALDRLTAPLFRPIRAIMPDFGGIDFSPLVLILLIKIAQMLLHGAARSLLTPAA
jgi:YggT family protein